MEDGRLFTSYITDSIQNLNVKNSMNIKNNEEYRQYLTHNAQQIMEKNKIHYESQNYKFVPLNTNKSKQNVPYLFNGLNDNHKPNGYEYSSTKTAYLSRQKLNDKTFNKYKR